MNSPPHKFQQDPSLYRDQKHFIASKQGAPYEYWYNFNQEFFTLQLLFLRPSVFYLNTDDWKPKFQTVKKEGIHHKTKKRFRWNLPPSFTKNSNFKIENLPLYFHFIHSAIWYVHIQLVRCNFMILWNNIFYAPQLVLQKDLRSIAEDCLLPIDYALIGSYWDPIASSHQYPQSSKVCDLPLNDKSLKT